MGIHPADGEAAVPSQTRPGLSPDTGDAGPPPVPPSGRVKPYLPLAAVTPEHAGRYAPKEAAAPVEIGRGGLGRVLIVHDSHLGRDVALKQLLPAPDASGTAEDAGRAPFSPPGTGAPSGVARFLREARIAGQLEHPNIVPIHEVGRHPDGTFYYTMKLVRGITMAETLRRCRTAADRLRLLPHYVDLCQAIAYAHSRGVIHRDIKTDNVMLGEFGETVVLDWGIAKVAGIPDDRTPAPAGRDPDPGEGSTQMGAILGTPAYMSPEQALGDVEEIDEQSDVWSLGAVLYEILTGEPPFNGASVAEVIARVVAARIPPARERNGEIPAELSAICERALQRDKRIRYPGAADLAADVLAYQAGARVRAYEYSSWELLRRFARKNRTAFGAALLILALILSATLALLVSWRKELAAGRQAQYHMAQAFDEKADRLNQELRYLVSPIYAAASLIHNPADMASPFHDPAFAGQFPESRRLRVDGVSKLYQATLNRCAELRFRLPTTSIATRVAFSPDGALVATGDYLGEVSAWDARTGRLRYRSACRAMVLGLRFSPDGRFLAVSASGLRVLILDAATGATVRVLTFSGRETRDLLFLGGGKWLTTAGDDRLLRFWETESWRQVRILGGHAEGIMCLAESPDGEILASGDRTGTVRFWRIRDGSLLGTLPAHADAVSGLAYHPGGRQLVSASWDRTVRVWSLPDLRPIRTLAGPRDIITGLALARDGDTLATFGMDKEARWYQLSSGSLFLVTDGFNNGVMNLAFSPAEEVLALPDNANAVSLWNFRPASRPLRLEGHAGIVMEAAFAPDGRNIATSGFDRTVKIWSTEDGRERHSLAGHAEAVWALEYAPDGATLASVSRDGEIRLWDPASGRLRLSRRLDRMRARYIDFSPDGRWLATAGVGPDVVLLDLAGGSGERRMRTGANENTGVAFLPDGRSLLSAGQDGNVRQWDIPGGRLRRVFSFGRPLYLVGVSPDGRRFATDTLDGAVTVQSLLGPGRTRLVTGQRDQIEAVWFSPDGRRLVSGGKDRTILLWTVDTGELDLVLRLDLEARVARFSPDGRTLAIGVGQTTVLYPLDFALIHSIARSPETYLRQAEQASGLRLDGFNLSVNAAERANH